MKRAAPLRRTARFGAQITAGMDRDQRIEARAARMANLAEVHRACPPIARGVVERVTGTAAFLPKPQARRNPALLEMARGRKCLLCPSGRCRCTPGSTVAAHSNLQEHGKGMGRKADDCYSVWAGAEAHRWLDQGGASEKVKRDAFMAAHLRQVLEWRRIADDPAEPERFRKAATWALRELEAAP